MSVLVDDNNIQEPEMVRVHREMEENARRIAEEHCRIQSVPVERGFVVRNRETVRYPDPNPIIHSVRQRCRTPDQIVDAQVSIFSI